MTYEIALNKAWDEIVALAPSQKYTIRLFTDFYEVKVTDRIVLLRASNAPASEDISILILHYLTGILKHGYNPKGKWISFKEVWGGQSYYPAFQKNTIDPILKSLKGKNDDLIRDLTGRLGGKIVEGGDVSVELVTFPEVHARIIFWFGDEELPPEIIIQFDRELAEIITTEDIAVLMFYLAKSIGGNG